MTLADFLARHPVFTTDEVAAFLAARGTTNPRARERLLAHYRQSGRVVRVRRGLYATMPLGADAATAPVDPYLVAAKLAEDSVLAYHSALAFHGRSYSIPSRVVFVSATRVQPVELPNATIVRAPVPAALAAEDAADFGVDEHNRSGVIVRVTTFERTLVDVLDRPDLGGGWEEIWRSLESVEFFDLDEVTAYVRLLGNATTAAKVGFYLDQHRDELMVEDRHLDPLLKLRPSRPHYLERDRRTGGRWIQRWNLMVPPKVLDRSWEMP